MALGELLQGQGSEVKTADTLDEVREYYLKICASLYGERLLLERSYRALDILTGDELNPNYSEIKSPRRTDFMKLTAGQLSAEIETVEAEYRKMLKTRKAMETNVMDLIKEYQGQLPRPVSGRSL